MTNILAILVGVTVAIGVVSYVLYLMTGKDAYERVAFICLLIVTLGAIAVALLIKAFGGAQ